ncbi:fimbria/pilus periplasmic chaperone [Kluyvera genomosp. 2]|uniref:fimbria/pilus periplasmic chaperone n=1 Tax=Kluyvera genomosp. 2 TaxID=2774054 RepID=UPI002FD84D3E
MNYFSRSLRTVSVAAFLMMSGYISQAAASVTMVGTRIIYHAEEKSVDVTLKNKDQFPYVISTWFDEGVMTDGPSKSVRVPFIVTPPAFRIQPNNGQVIRIVFTGNKKLPQDRESLFYFNFLQVPPSNNQGGTATTKQNSLLVMLRNRVKLFYRPAGLATDAKDMLDNLKVAAAHHNNKAGVVIRNEQPYYVTITGLKIAGTSKIYAPKNDMIAPFSSEIYVFPGARPSAVNSVEVTLINDQGARISENYPL